MATKRSILIDQLGMSPTKARNRLIRIILFDLVKKLNLDICFRCGNKIETLKELSIEHKVAWLHNKVELYWDLDNISFSHLLCNIGRTTYPVKCKTGDHWCNHCKQCLSVSLFGKRKQKGFARYRNFCNPCRGIRRKQGLSW